MIKQPVIVLILFITQIMVFPVKGEHMPDKKAIYAAPFPRYLIDRHTMKKRDQEVERLVQQLSPYFRGHMTLTFSDPYWLDYAISLRDRLISRGISAEKVIIQLQQNLPSTRRQVVGIQIELWQKGSTPLPCQTQPMDYHFSTLDRWDCALNTTLSRSLVSPFKHHF